MSTCKSKRRGERNSTMEIGATLTPIFGDNNSLNKIKEEATMDGEIKVEATTDGETKGTMDGISHRTMMVGISKEEIMDGVIKEETMDGEIKVATKVTTVGETKVATKVTTVGEIKAVIMVGEIKVETMDGVIKVETTKEEITVVLGYNLGMLCLEINKCGEITYLELIGFKIR